MNANERDYLVIFEEPDDDGLPTDDTLQLDIESPQHGAPLGEIDVQQKVDLELSNTTNRVGTFGFILSILGSLLGAALMVTFGMTYPDQWYGDDGSIDTGLIQLIVTLAITCILLLVAGTILTHYGRRIHAHGRLSSVRLIEKATGSRAHFD